MSKMERSSSTTKKTECWCIGGGMVHDAISPDYELCKTLNCMVDVMKVLVITKGDSNEAKDKE